MVKKQLTHISEKEIEILEAFRTLDEDDQKIFYHELKTDALKAKIKAKETNSNIVKRCKISSLIYVDFETKNTAGLK